MSFKDNLQKRIEKNAVKSNLAWTDKHGVEHSETVLLKKSRMPLVGDWARIYPPLNENGSVNILNLVFGGRKNFIKLLMIFLVLFLIYSWTTGILGVNAEYMNGQKYIIVEREAFDKYCTTSISGGEQGHLYKTPNNLSIFKVSEDS